MSSPLLTSRQRAFVSAYMVDSNATRAAIRAGYSARTARSIGSENLTKPHIAAEIAAAEAEVFERNKVRVDELVQGYARLLRADPRELTELRIGACRSCQGIRHAYHWRTPDEFQEAKAAWAALSKTRQALTPLPADRGGYGYRHKAQPHPDCPGCDGYGVPRILLKDTTRLSPEALRLFAGVRRTRQGVEIRMHDPLRALDALAKHLGFFKAHRQKRAAQAHPVHAPVVAALFGIINGRGSRARVVKEGAPG